MSFSNKIGKSLDIPRKGFTIILRQSRVEKQDQFLGSMLLKARRLFEWIQAVFSAKRMLAMRRDARHSTTDGSSDLPVIHSDSLAILPGKTGQGGSLP